MQKTVRIKQDIAKEIQDFLNKDVPVPDAGLDEVMNTFTVNFCKGIEADIKFCNGDTGPWIDAVLFEHGQEVQVLEPSDMLLGEYPFEHNGKEYIAILE